MHYDQQTFTLLNIFSLGNVILNFEIIKLKMYQRVVLKWCNCKILN